MQDSPLTLLPPVIAIIIAIWRKNALLALFSGMVLSFVMIANWQPLEGISNSALGLINVFSSTGNVYIVTFSLLIGALVALMNQSGAVNGFIALLAKLNLVKNSRQAAILPTVVGTSIFTDTNLSMFLPPPSMTSMQTNSRRTRILGYQVFDILFYGIV